MKTLKTKRIVGLLTVMLLCVVIMSACGKSSKFVGTWKYTPQSDLGELGTKAASLLTGQDFSNLTITFQSGDKATINLDEVVVDGTYSVNDEDTQATVSLTIDEESGENLPDILRFTYNEDGTISCDTLGDIVFTK